MRKRRSPIFHASVQGAGRLREVFTGLKSQAERLMRTIREEEVDLSEYRDMAGAPARTANWVGSWTTCITGSGSTRRWAT